MDNIGMKQEDLKRAMTTGQKIAVMRRSLGLSQEQLACILHTSQPYINNCEHDRIDPKASTIRKLCNALECEPNDLIGDDME